MIIGFWLIYSICCLIVNAKRVLVAGGAGFIGFHTALKLAEDSDNKVVVLDVFDDSYSVHLKRARAGVLKEKGVVVHSGDVCSKQMLDYLFKEFDFSSVIHLAGKEGALASMEDPIGYTTANSKCLLKLLETLTEHEETHLVYASSYSVYGNQGNDPVSVHDSIGPPMSMYAALKIGAEKMVRSYCLRYQLSAVGLRLFSVYGPWGRPDGDIYKITSLVDKNKQVKIYKKDSIIASRDYTYIDDAVNGIIAAMNYKPTTCNTIFNIGSGRKPVTMETVHKLIANELMLMKNKLVYEQLPLYEPLVTNANIVYTTKELGYSPITSIDEGIQLFLNWYKLYHKDKKWKLKRFLRWPHFRTCFGCKKSSHPDDEVQNKLHDERIDYINGEYLDRIANFKSKFEDYAETHGMPHVKHYTKKNFLEIKGKQPGTQSRKKLKGATIEELRKRCLMVYECVAFDTDGRMYPYIGREKDWKPFDGTTYLADIDICKAGITSCYGNCTCKYTGPSQAEFGCKEGLDILRRGNKYVCLEEYSPHTTTYKEEEFKIVDRIEGRDWNSIIKDIPYTRFNDTNLATGAIALYPEGRGNPKMLQDACDNTYHCVGFSTDGSLFGMIGTDWYDRRNYDLFIRDINYCTLNYKSCTCKRTETGRYRCPEEDKKKKHH